jgi:hypothetical protein
VTTTTKDNHPQVTASIASARSARLPIFSAIMILWRNQPTYGRNCGQSDDETRPREEPFEPESLADERKPIGPWG